MANYGEVLFALKRGKSARRKGWNGKGMSISLTEGSHDFDTTPLERIAGIPAHLFVRDHTGTCTRLPQITFKTAQGYYPSGFTATMTEQLAEDWEIL